MSKIKKKNAHVYYEWSLTENFSKLPHCMYALTIFFTFQEENQRPQQQQHRPMILAKRKNDLYENISDDFLSLRSNSMRAKAERLAKCKSVPSFINSFNLTSASVSEANLLRPDQGYGNRYNLIDC